MSPRRGGAEHRPPSAPADRRLLRRASLVVAAQTAVAVALVIGVLVALVYSISGQERISATDHKLEAKLAESAPGETIVDGAPEGCPEDEVRAAVDARGAGTHRFEVCDTPFLAHVEETGGDRVAAATNFTEQQEETERLARLSILVGAVGVLAAAGLGWLVARRAVRPLGDALTSQRRFVAEASHELRTPLAILHTRAQLLQRRPVGDDDQRQEIDQLVDDARVLNDIVNDLLLSAEMQFRPESRQPVDLARVATEVKDSFSATADDAGVDLVVDSDPAESHVVTGVPSALRRAVAALVDNSMDHVARGGTITLGLSGSGGTVRISVIDDGDGLDPELAAQLTQRFRRGSGGNGHHPRLGLGLALVDEIVHAHDGTLAIDGRPGDGAIVTLTFPAAP
ncbi:HAMP domain-containing sensor histidine kinase [Jiangella sp. DSM 45060]|uniref:sensor histidine kinase n=1 Tax=Jiangella sp. DSM 45060 TaxID=1798224 RepID=UPI00087D1AD0|nr:HAMP domain-containing sensor histidine kinase [Jiangella sp. DSM 45060]SDT71516.1 His Kinase A (phospho-acceptor) domain-containing protein [Jiangella sp. DSM 45060]